jgi:4-hydroxythreonine-4-phosphate dehydrogenase
VDLTKRIGVVMGDPSGIGPEVALKAAGSIDPESGIEPVLIGSGAVFERDIHEYGLRIRLTTGSTGGSPDTLEVIDPVSAEAETFQYGSPTSRSGKAAYDSIARAVELAAVGKLDALVTGPISKLALRQAGIGFPGHTELLAHLTKTPRFGMMLASGKLRVTLVTAHTAISEVAKQINAKSVFDKIELSCIFLKHYADIESPTIGVCALNPHGGEGGIFGSEEKEIDSAVKRAIEAGIRVEGPFPADSLFSRWQRYDCIVANYHDQGLIPVKMLAFRKSVNVTLGLPIIRTSPDHGTAFDIAGKGIADPQSMIEAIGFAYRMAMSGRAEWH